LRSAAAAADTAIHDNFKDEVVGLMAQVTDRGVKRD